MPTAGHFLGCAAQSQSRWGFDGKRPEGDDGHHGLQRKRTSARSRHLSH